VRPSYSKENDMRHINIILIVAVMTTALICAGGQTPKVKTQTPQSSIQAAKPKGKTLVKRLPAGLEGVEIKGGAVVAKAGYKFVKQANGSVTVARIKGGGNNVGGSWNCDCWSGTGGCEAYIVGDTISCLKSKDGCTGSCKLSVVIKGATTGVVIY
jgi:hypothetical protein